MAEQKKIGWDISHLEFTIEDHYYFSKLKNAILQNGAEVEEVRKLGDIFDYDVFIVNYPEKPFTPEEVSLVRGFLNAGNRVIACGYYDNEDRVAERLNTLSRPFGITVCEGRVTDDEHNHRGDELLVVTDKVLKYCDSVHSVMFPCSAPLQFQAGEIETVGQRQSGSTGSGEVVAIAAQAVVGDGRFVVIGTCVFWDNFSLTHYSNEQFSLNLLLGD